jgi:2',3'-cyclic-nucleotide 2'-phosphodiesterase (5'-nucleotidase family)
VTATTFGNHEFDFGLTRLFNQQVVSDFSYLAVNIVDKETGQIPDWAIPSMVVEVNGIQVGLIGAALEITPELVKPVNVETLEFLPALPAVMAESEKLTNMGVNVQVLLVHEGAAVGNNAVGVTKATPWEGPGVTLAQNLQDSSVDVIFGGHTHWPTNVMIGDILLMEGTNAGKDTTVVQLLVSDNEVVWAGGSTFLPKTLGVAQRPDVKAIVDEANAATAPLRNVVIGTQAFDIKRDPTRLSESAMGNLVADALTWFYPTVEASLTNSGGLRADINCNPPSGGEQSCEITWGEAFTVLPFGNSTVIETLTGDQLSQAMMNGLSPKCDTAISTGRFPQVSGLKIQFSCDVVTKKPIIEGMWKTPDGPGGVEIPILPADTIVIVTNDFMATGGDGYTVLKNGTDIKYPGDLLLDVVIEYIKTFSPVAPVVDGRVVYTTLGLEEFIATHPPMLWIPLIGR